MIFAYLDFFIYLCRKIITKLVFMFKIIACINEKRVIGREGKLLYHIKNDLANFKSMTVGNVVIMGAGHLKVCLVVSHSQAESILFSLQTLNIA